MSLFDQMEERFLNSEINTFSDYSPEYDENSELEKADEKGE